MYPKLSIAHHHQKMSKRWMDVATDDEGSDGGSDAMAITINEGPSRSVRLRTNDTTADSVPFAVPPTHIDALPTEVMLMIMEYLSPAEIAINVNKTSRAFRRIAESAFDVQSSTMQKEHRTGGIVDAKVETRNDVDGIIIVTLSRGFNKVLVNRVRLPLETIDANRITGIKFNNIVTSKPLPFKLPVLPNLTQLTIEGKDVVVDITHALPTLQKIELNDAVILGTPLAQPRTIQQITLRGRIRGSLEVLDGWEAKHLIIIGYLIDDATPMPRIYCTDLSVSNTPFDDLQRLHPDFIEKLRFQNGRMDDYNAAFAKWIRRCRRLQDISMMNMTVPSQLQAPTTVRAIDLMYVKVPVGTHWILPDSMDNLTMHLGDDDAIQEFRISGLKTINHLQITNATLIFNQPIAAHHVKISEMFAGWMSLVPDAIRHLTISKTTSHKHDEAMFLQRVPSTATVNYHGGIHQNTFVCSAGKVAVENAEDDDVQTMVSLPAAEWFGLRVER
jgi:hypothetical protein